MNARILAKANQIIQTCDTAYFAVLDEQGSPNVSTVSTIKPENIAVAYFATSVAANKTKRLLRDQRASVCYHSGDNNITLVGTAAIYTDQPTKSRLWLDWFSNHFPGGETDPDYCIIKFTTQRLSLWIDYESAEFSLDELRAL